MAVSPLVPSEHAIEFNPYALDELVNILSDRANSSLAPDCVSSRQIERICKLANGDARIALLILKSAAKNAEARHLSRISDEDIGQAGRGASKFRLSYLLAELNEHQRTIYSILKMKGPMDSGKLYLEYCKSVTYPVVDRAYRKYMEAMVELGMVRAEGSGRWKVYKINC